jgi:hypothetical protein
LAQTSRCSRSKRDEGRRRVDDELELLACAPGVQLGLLALRDVLAGAEHARAHAVRGALEVQPGVEHPDAAVGAYDAVLRLRRLEALEALKGARVHGIAVGGVHALHELRPADRGPGRVPEHPVRLGRPERAPRNLGQPLVDDQLPASHLRGRLRLLQHPLASPQRRLDGLHLADVGHQHHEASHPPAAVDVGNVGHAHVAGRAALEHQPVLEGDLLAGERPLHVRLDIDPRRGVDHLAGVPSDDRLERAVEPAPVTLVDPDVPHVGVDVRQQRGHGVGREHHALRSLARGGFRALRGRHRHGCGTAR